MVTPPEPSPEGMDVIRSLASLPISDRVTATRTSLQIEGDLSYEEWELLGQGLQTLSGAWQWWVGDRLCYGEKRYGERYAQAVEASEHLGISVDSIRQAQWVAEKVPVVIRNYNLTWTHHYAVASLDAAEQKRILSEATTRRLSVSKTKELVRVYKAIQNGDDPDKPKKKPDSGKDKDYDLAADLGRAQEEIDDLEELAKSLSKNNPEGEVKAWAEKFHGLDTQFREILVVRDNLRSRDRYATKLSSAILPDSIPAIRTTRETPPTRVPRGLELVRDS